MKVIENIKISVRLFIAFFMVVIISTLIGISGILSIDQIKDLDNKMYSKMTSPMQYLVSMTSSYGSIRARIRDVMMSSNQNELIKYEEEINSYSLNFDNSLNTFSKTILSKEGQETASNLNQSKQSYMNMAEQIINLIKTKKVKEASSILYGDMTATQKNMDNYLSKLANLKIKLASETADSNKSTASDSIVTMVVLIIIGIAISALLGFLITRSINRPIRKLITVAQKIGDGDLGIDVDDSAKDEIGALSKVFKHMAANLNEVMSNINSAAEQVAAGSKQVSDSSIALSQGSTEQASSIEELTASMEEISAQTKVNAENASKVSEISQGAKGAAIHGRDSMRDMLSSMEEINVASNKISKIIKVIDDIAFQTNILALNAAVEAARAGQHGRGFAVVAEEVRNLAARSAVAAKETTDMIEGSIKKVETGTKIANETSESLNNIVDGVEKVASLVGDIAVACNEQSLGIEQINQGIIQVAQVVTENSATSQQSAAASQELAGQADLLNGQVSKFILRKTKDIRLN